MDTALDRARPGRRLGARFGLLWAGQSVSLIGDQITLIALPLLAVQYSRASTADIGILGASLRLPFLVIGLPAGVWVTRIGLSRSMMGADVIRGAALAAAAALTVLGVDRPAVLWAAAFVVGCATVFFQLSYQTVVPDLVDDADRWQAANTRLSLSESMSLLLGPAVGGAVVAWWSPPGALTIDVLTYAVSVATLLMLSSLRSAPARRPSVSVGVRRQVVEGWRYVRESPVLNAIMWTGAWYNLGTAMYDSLIIVFGVRHLHLGAGAIGLAIGIGGVGFPLGSVIAAPVTARLGLGPSLLWAAVPSVAGLLVTAAAVGHPLAFIAGGTFLVGIGQGCFAVNAITLRQLCAAPRFRARATAVHRFASWGTLPVGALVGGLIGQYFGLRAAMIVAGLTACLCAWPLLRSPLRTTRTVSPLLEP